jgi:predicted RNA-binding Zn-ribbon protein involved in translation (DUF1610 family)
VLRWCREVIDVEDPQSEQRPVRERPADSQYTCPQCGAPMAGICGETCRNCGFHLGCGTEP